MKIPGTLLAGVVAVLTTTTALADRAPIAERLGRAAAERGERLVSTQCAAACHTYEQDGPPRVGPNLWGIVGRPMASKDGYRYSAALRRRAEDGEVWTYEALDEYLASPRKFVPGTAMTYVGMRKPSDRADVILYLRSLSEKEQPLPGQE